MTTGRRRQICAGFVAGLLLATIAHAGSGGSASSSVKARNRHGLNVSVDSRGIESDGYRPIRVKITPWPPVASTSERSIRIAVQPNYYDVGAIDTEVSQVFELKQGDTSVEGTVLVPQDRIFGFIRVEVHEDGERLSGMEMSLNSPRGGYWNYSGANTSILFIDSDAPNRDRQVAAVQERTSGRWKGADTFLLPDVRHLSAIYPDPHSGMAASTVMMSGDSAELPKQPDIATIALIHDHARFDLVPPAELPDHWLALTGYDVIYLDRKDLLLIAEKFPERLRAILDWLQTGSLLLIADGGKEFEHLETLEKLLGLPAAPTSDKSRSVAHQPGWTFPNEKDLEKAATPATAQPGMVYRGGRTYYNNGTEVDPLSLSKEERTKLIKATPYVYRNAGLGCVAVFREEKPLSQSVAWRALFASAGNQRMRWQERHGISSTGRNPGYWSFLIPGVGMAPVMAFLLLISLFMLIVGPVNYWLLRRARRTHLLLLTVPAGALVMTVGLFLYALIIDGLGVTSRIRSFTWLDERGRAVSWSRHSYYASLSPAKGLIFPADAAAYPIVSDAWRTQHASRQRRMRWEDDEQRLQAGFVQPRTVTQFLVLRATDAKQSLKWSTPSATPDAPELTNELGVKIERLLAKNERGDLFRGENIAPGAKVELVPVQANDAKAEWKMLCTRNEPKPLHGDDLSHEQNLMSFIMPDFRYGQWIETQGVESSLLEKRLQDAKSGDPPARTWIAETARPPAVPKAVDYAVEKAGFHLMGGSW